MTRCIQEINNKPTIIGNPNHLGLVVNVLTPNIMKPFFNQANNLKRKAVVADDDEVRNRRRLRFMKMEEKQRSLLNKTNQEPSLEPKNIRTSKINQKPTLESKIQEDENGIDLTLTLAPPNSSLTPSSASTLCSGSTSTLSSVVVVPQVVVREEQEVAQVVQQGPWTIIKNLTKSDISPRQCRLLIEKHNVRHIMNHIKDDNDKVKVYEKKFGINVYDSDTNQVFEMKFSYWKSSDGFVINGKWEVNFVKRRGLKLNDTIGLRWDHLHKRLIFSVLNRAAS